MKTSLKSLKRTTAVLLVEDELSPRKLMALNLTRVQADASIGIKSCFAAYIHTAIRWLRTEPIDVMSLDMRMPYEAGAEIQALTGINFAKHPLATTTMSKTLVLSSTIEVEGARTRLREALEVAGAPIEDKYAKSERTLPPSDEIPYESLTYHDWAQRVFLYVETNTKSFATPGGSRLSAAGHWLQIGQKVLPPLLARHVALLDRHWDDRFTPPLDAAHRFIETCERLALAQTAVVLKAAGVPDKSLNAPNAWQRKGVQDTLSDWRLKLDVLSREGHDCWNWQNWLTDETLSAMNLARELRNQRAHGLAMTNPSQDWQQLYQSLRSVMDMASYWAMHPLCVSFQSGRDGIRAQLVTSTEMPLPVRLLDAEISVPQEAESDSSTCWQAIWYASGNGQAIDENTPPVWSSVMTSWAHWIERDAKGSVWLKLWSKPGLTEWLDLVSGETRRANIS